MQSQFHQWPGEDDLLPPMTNMVCMRVDVALLPRDLDPQLLASRAVVVFDVLRATTTMTAALAAGVGEIRVFPNTEAARKEAASVGLYPKPLLCGEENCLAPTDFDLGNSPGDFDRSLKDRTLFMSTTNGTRAIIAAAEAKLLLVGALVNASAVAKVLAESKLDVILLCAGTNGKVAIEDVIGAGAVLTALKRIERVEGESDAARVALRLFEVSRDDLKSALSSGAGGRNVINAGLAADIDFAASLDRFKNVVGQVEGREVRRVSF
jgi:2-phosphosulfolactate phosphatase